MALEEENPVACQSHWTLDCLEKESAGVELENWECLVHFAPFLSFPLYIYLILVVLVIGIDLYIVSGVQGDETRRDDE